MFSSLYSRDTISGHFWYTNDISWLENGIAPQLSVASLGLPTEQRIYTLFVIAPTVGGVGALGSTREGTHCCVCIIKRILLSRGKNDLARGSVWDLHTAASV